MPARAFPRPVPRRFARALGPGLVVFAAALRCSAPTDPAAAVAGTYTLLTVAGRPLPAAIVAGLDLSTQVAQATRTLDADGTCRESGTFTTMLGPDPFPGGAFTGTAMTCRWTVSGDTVTFTTTSATGLYAASTVATITAIGTLTESTGAPPSPLLNGPVYPRTYGR